MNKNIPMKLTHDCTCPVCGFKTMATRCRQCGQRIIGEEESVMGRPSSFVYMVYEGRKLIAEGDAREVGKVLGYKSRSAVRNACNGRCLVKGKYTIKRRMINDK